MHILNESRGSTLEVVISRMKALALGVRFLLVSATVPNIRDIAEWVGNSLKGIGLPASVYEVRYSVMSANCLTHMLSSCLVWGRISPLQNYTPCNGLSEEESERFSVLPHFRLQALSYHSAARKRKTNVNIL